MIDKDIKTQIFEIFKTRFEAANVKDVKNIFVYYEKGKRVSVGYDNVKPDLCGYADNLIMKNFLVSQIKSHLYKQTGEKLDITFALTTIDLINQTIELKCFYDTKTEKQKLFSHVI